jgi:hypothetical protein
MNDLRHRSSKGCQEFSLFIQILWIHSGGINMNTSNNRLGLAAAGFLLALAPMVHAADTGFDNSMFSVDYGVSSTNPASSFFSISHADATGSATSIEAANLAGWQLDTTGTGLTLTWNKAEQFMNSGSPAFIGFKISDTGNHLADILGASVTNAAYVPLTYGNLVEGFTPSQVSFDANNIYINLNTAMWHEAPMASMGDPYRDKIALSVDFAAAPVPEPETYAMLLAGLGLMGAMVRRRSMLG